METVSKLRRVAWWGTVGELVGLVGDLVSKAKTTRGLDRMMERSGVCSNKCWNFRECNSVKYAFFEIVKL